MTRADEAARLFAEGASCSQAVFVAFAPSLGVDAVQAFRLASGFGGGMHVGGTCGAATGAVLALGLASAGEDPASDRSAVTAAVEWFFARFSHRVGATDCPAILECDVCSAEGWARVKERGLRESRCLPAVRVAAEILEEMFVTDADEFYFSQRKPATCPACGSPRVALIVYGLPGPDMLEEEDAGTIVLGGCCVSEVDPEWRCLECDVSIYPEHLRGHLPPERADIG